MNAHPSNRLSEAGFTLVELMMVVSIIGMLASIAVPSYQRFQARARQAEAKIKLAAIYTVEKAYYADQSTYTDCIRQAGYIIDPGNKYYLVGIWHPLISNDCGPPGTPTGTPASFCFNIIFGTPTPTTCNCNWDPVNDNDCTYHPTLRANMSLPMPGSTSGVEQFGLGYDPDWAAHQGTFRIGAVGSISTTGVYDVWIIDDNKAITNIQSGL